MTDRYATSNDSFDPAEINDQEVLDRINEEQDSPAFPARVYKQLPAVMQRATRFFDNWYERDVYLTGLIGALSAAMPRLRFLYGKRYHSPHLYFFVLASSASGKSAMEDAFQCLTKIDERLIAESKEKIQQWKREVEEYERSRQDGTAGAHPGAEPPRRCLVAGEDTSFAQLARRIARNKEGVFMGSTEADAVTNANARQFGNFSYLFRKATHHDRVQIDRKSSPTLRITHPRVALVLSGTEDQFGRLVESVQNGLYSRFGVYRFEAPTKWQSQYPSHEDQQFEDFSDELATWTLKMWEALRQRAEDKPLYFDVSKHLWKRVDAHYERLFNTLFQDHDVTPHLQATVKRGALITFRIAMVLSVVRCFENDARLSSTASLEAQEEDVEAALNLGLVYTEHGLRQAQKCSVLPDIAEVGGKVRMTGQQRQFLDSLPITFNSKDAEEAGKEVGIHRATVYRWLDNFRGSGLIQKNKHGLYSQTGATSATAATHATTGPHDPESAKSDATFNATTDSEENDDEVAF